MAVVLNHDTYYSISNCLCDFSIAILYSVTPASYIRGFVSE